ncbi:MAG: hypothetical protein OEL57_02910 [Trichlorobacter sp.]|nr:hypothetical protein [Trichlorobacter sp.]MDK9716841.1 hypothetical protein [Trichlorobacter sp.]
MQKTCFTTIQITTIFKEAETGMLMKEIYRKHGISVETTPHEQ